MADTATLLHVTAPKLEAFIVQAFQAVGISTAESKSIAELMVRADMQGSEGSSGGKTTSTSTSTANCPR